MTNKLTIGWASADITPARPVNLLGQFHSRISQGIRDPLTLTALAIATQDDQLIFVSIDNCFLNTPIITGIREAVASYKLGIDPTKIIPHSTHTHTAPIIDDETYPPIPADVMTGKAYANFLIERAALAVAEAWRNRAPGKAAWGLSHAVIGRNRRAVYFNDPPQAQSHRPGCCTTRYAQMYGKTNQSAFSHIEGYEDHNVELLFTWNADDELTGALINVACPSQETEGLSVVSADFWHETRQMLRQKLNNEKLFILPQCAFAGDQSPHLLWYSAAERRMQKLRGTDNRQEIARRITNAVLDALPAIQQERHDCAFLKHIVLQANLPRRLITDAEAKLLREGIAQLEKQTATPPTATPEQILRAESSHATMLLRCKSVLRRYENQAQEKTYPVELHAVRIGEIAFATSPFETYLDYGIRIKARSPALQTFLVQLACAGAGFEGNYLPTARSEQGESYGANFYCNAVGSAGGQMLVEEILKALNAMWAANSNAPGVG